MISKLLKLYVLSNVHISLAAAIFVASAYAISGTSIDVWYITFIFCGTLIIYNLHRLIALRKIEHSRRSLRHKIFESKEILTICLLGLIVAVGLMSYLLLEYKMQINLLIPSILSLLYILPLFRNKRLRDIHFIKIFIVALTWASFYVIPFTPFSSLDFVTLLEKFCFIFALTIPFDIRDRDVDNLHNLKTLGNVRMLNIEPLFLSILLLIVAAACITWLSYHDMISYGMGLILIVFYFLTGILIQYSRNANEMYHLLYLDGLILIQGLLILMYSSIF